MKNREVYLKDPAQVKLLNNGVANVTDARTSAELQTLRYELETFVCDGEYAKGLRRILESFIQNLKYPEQPAVWISGFFGSGKSHLVKMLRTLWVDFSFPDDNATARGLVHLTADIADLFRELTTASRMAGGVHAAAGTLGAGAGDNVRMALLAIVFRSVGLPEEYPLARFEMWLRSLGYLDAVKSEVEMAGKDWRSELHKLYVSPLIARALLHVYPDFAASSTDARLLLKEQFPNVTDVTNQQMVDTIKEVLSVNGKFPLTLIALDEVQQYIGENPQRSIAVQEVVEACCKSFGSRLLFVATGQTALSGTSFFARLKGRFRISIELSDVDVDTVIRHVILAKKPDARKAIETTLTANLGEVSRHLAGTRIEHHPDDERYYVQDYPILPVRRRFWERVLRSVDQSGTEGQLRNQLKLAHDAVRHTSEEPLGTVVAGDYIFDQIAPNLLQTGELSREIYEHIQQLWAGGAGDQVKARLCGLVFLIGKLPRGHGEDLGIRATPDTLADLLVEDLSAGSSALRKQVPQLLASLETSGIVMRVGDEFRLQTRESAIWNDEYRSQVTKLTQDPQRLDQERAELFKAQSSVRLKNLRLMQGQSKEPRSVLLHFGSDAPKDADKAVYASIRDGWTEEEKDVLADVRAFGNKSPMIFVYVPKRHADDLRQAITQLRAAKATLERRGVPNTAEGEEARRSVQTRESEAARRQENLLDEIFGGARVFLAGGQEITVNDLGEAVRLAAEAALVRLYPQFDVADHAGWEKVVKQAQGGSEAALEAVDYRGDVDKHPVTSAILRVVAAGKKGSDIRSQFEGSQYGWPKDAIDGALYTLVVTGHLRALDGNHNPIEVKNLERSKIAQTIFRLESTTVTALQRVEVRKLLQECGIPCRPNEELQAIPALLRELKQRANGAGGEPPRPERPDTSHIDALMALVGNEQLVAVHAQREMLREEARTWALAGEAIEKRMESWKTLMELLENAATLPEAASVQGQVDVIVAQRQLLADPDVVPALAEQVTQILRKALLDVQKAYKDAYDKGLQMLENDESWGQLDAERRTKLLQAHGLSQLPAVRTGTALEVLGSLRAMNFGTWGDRTAALPTRFDKVRMEATELVQPKAITYRAPARTLKSAEEVKAWVAEVERELLERVQQGPVVVH